MEATTLVFTVSELASQEIAKIAAENNIENPMLRIRVVPGGCSGFPIPPSGRSSSGLLVNK